MKRLLNNFSLAKGFTLIELLVVIAIIGVLAAVLVAVIDPLDKIRASADVGVINTITQAGRGNDNFAAGNSNGYIGTSAEFATLGETKSTPTQPTGYTFGYFASTTATTNAACTTALQNCTSALWFTSLVSKKYTGANTGTNVSYYLYRDGIGCFKTNIAAYPSQTNAFAAGPPAAYVCP